MVCTNRESRLLMFILSKGWYERFLLTRHYKTWGGVKWLPCNYSVDFPRSVPVSAAPSSKRLSHKQGFCCWTRLSAQPFIVHCIVLFFGWFFSRIFLLEALSLITFHCGGVCGSHHTNKLTTSRMKYRTNSVSGLGLKAWGIAKNRVAEKPTWPTLWNI